MSKHSPLLFNFSSMSNAKSTASKKFINQHQNENQPPHNYSKRKRNFAELENSNFQLSDRGSSNIRLSIPKVSSIHTEKSIKPITNKFKTVSNNSAEKTEDDANRELPRERPRENDLPRPRSQVCQKPSLHDST